MQAPIMQIALCTHGLGFCMHLQLLTPSMNCITLLPLLSLLFLVVMVLEEVVETSFSMTPQDNRLANGIYPDNMCVALADPVKA
jgi:hypothetical protein